MAEIFGAVASGAGLVSLSMQLLDSAQKLKGFCDLCRDAPETVKQLYSDLETMALALRQFEQYRQNDVFGSELLSRCIVACDQAVARIKTAIDKVDRLLSRARFAGRIYMGFKEPEVRKLLEDMERAKSSMLLAYTSYCQLWNMQQTANHAAALSLQSRQLERLQASVQSGNLALFGHITTFASQQIASCDEPAQRTVSKQHISPTRLARKRVKQGIDYTFRLRLPRRLVDCVWEFGVHECDNIWTFQLKPINIRPAHTFVFDFVRAGDTDAVRELLRSGQLSVHDRQASKNGNKTLLEIAARAGHLELCRFLLRETSQIHDNAVLSSALNKCLKYAYWGQKTRFKDGFIAKEVDSLVETFYDLFVREHNLEVDLMDSSISSATVWRPQFWHMLHTKTSFEVVVASQPTPLADLPLAQQFNAAIDSFGWPADVFSTMLHRHPTELMTMATDQGMTALHWAATHLGQWLCLLRETHSEKIGSYAKLASDLISAGANIHALWYERVESSSGAQSLIGYDPFLCFLRGVELDIKPYWSYTDIDNAISQWGRVLVAGGLSLEDYVDAENEFLGSIKCADHKLSCPNDLHPAKLLVSKDSVLTMETMKVAFIPVWEAIPTRIPGAWPMPSTLPSTISWTPDELDGSDNYRWVYIQTKSLKPKYNDRDVTDAVNTSYWICDWPVDSAGEESEANQDDHGLVARIFAQERSRKRHAGQITGRSRTASAPPPLKASRSLHRRWLMQRRIALASGWDFYVHKCPLNSRWHRLARGVLWLNQWRYCMQGRCHEWKYDDESQYDFTFEGWLLRDEVNVQVAKRYAAKFCPERMDIVDATLSRVTERALLAMGPKTREDAKM